MTVAAPPHPTYPTMTRSRSSEWPVGTPVRVISLDPGHWADFDDDMMLAVHRLLVGQLGTIFEVQPEMGTDYQGWIRVRFTNDIDELEELDCSTNDIYLSATDVMLAEATITEPDDFPWDPQ